MVERFIIFSNDFDFVEANTPSKLKSAKDRNKEFKWIFMVKEDVVDQVQPLTKNVKEMIDLQRKKIDLLFDTIASAMKEKG